MTLFPLQISNPDHPTSSQPVAPLYLYPHVLLLQLSSGPVQFAAEVLPVQQAVVVGEHL